MTTYQLMSIVPINQWFIGANDIGEFYCRMNPYLRYYTEPMLGQPAQYTPEPLKWRELDHIMDEDDGA